MLAKNILGEVHRLRNQATYAFQVPLFGLRHTSNDNFLCVGMAIQRDFTVGVQKAGFIVGTL